MQIEVAPERPRLAVKVAAAPAVLVCLRALPVFRRIRNLAPCLGGETTPSKILSLKDRFAINRHQCADLRSLWLLHPAFADPHPALLHPRSRLGIGAHALSRPPWPLSPILLCETSSRDVGMLLGSAGVSPSNFRPLLSRASRWCRPKRIFGRKRRGRSFVCVSHSTGSAG